MQSNSSIAQHYLFLTPFMPNRIETFSRDESRCGHAAFGCTHPPSLASQSHSVPQPRLLSVSAHRGRVWRLRTTLNEQLECNYWISHMQSTQFTAYATPTQRLLVGYTRWELLYNVYLSAVLRIHGRQKLCGPLGWHRPKPDPNNSLPASSR